MSFGMDHSPFLPLAAEASESEALTARRSTRFEHVGADERSSNITMLSIRSTPSSPGALSAPDGLAGGSRG